MDFCDVNVKASIHLSRKHKIPYLFCLSSTTFQHSFTDKIWEEGK